ncbi:DUF2703 domain-containing protein [Rouxiella badensis]|uniref:DUF2703 domain-containing protein n=1 Tax=Rahnella perminowiae TaxID=2816244 RepID=A0ABS6KVZ9_9GAMM|nr:MULTISPECIES: DUF2703 domain-containing protein [Yersiniaceae]MBU9810773.1 hypothetical protein [Rahnella perminowiae]MBU9833509.1 hypothetical protein [Rahnella perminowiae]MBU9865028.1 hypothetical protein [Rahnella aceris]MCC3735734.1 DUF2703 domain-containing protein [Rouxiella badensis]MCC3742691.1 DUF2703 domain-containing protein [Rouxiella badensis]
MRNLNIELLYTEDCPSHQDALAQLYRILLEFGIPISSVILTEISLPDEAEQARFPGSPTIRIQGIDIIDADDGPPSLSCRMYRSQSGKFNSLPEDADILLALHRALEEKQESDAD